MFKEKKLISYRKFEDKSFPILTIPSGTILFRYVKDPKTQIFDFTGRYDEKIDAYNLSPFHNTFFYFNPYIIDTNSYIPEEIKGKEPNMVVYLVTKDIKVLLMINPSNLTKRKKFSGIISCKDILECNGDPGLKSDSCFNKKFIDQNPDVVGKINIKYKDNVDLKNAMELGKVEDFEKFFSFYRDADFNTGTPEISLYPRTKIDNICITTKLDLSKGYEWIKENIDHFNYFPLFVFPHLPYEKDSLYKFLNESFRPEGYRDLENGKIYHLGIDKRTYFYILYEAVSQDTLKFCEDIKVEDKLKILKKNNPDLILDYAYKIS